MTEVEITDLHRAELDAWSKSPGDWGKFGSDDMTRYAKAAPNRRRKCRCGCGGPLTHYGMANGVALVGGCEWLVRRWVRGQSPTGGKRWPWVPASRQGDTDESEENALAEKWAAARRGDTHA